MRRGSLVLALTVLGLLLLAGAAGAATWLRTGYDPGRTGAVPFEGPQTNDTAFQVQLPGTPEGEVILADGAAYVLTDAVHPYYEGDTEGLDQEALWRIELATGEVERVLDWPGEDPEKVTPNVVLSEEGKWLIATEVPSGEERWRTHALNGTRTVSAAGYADRPLVVDGVLYIAFSAVQGPESQSGGECVAACVETDGVMALDLETGETEWEVNLTRERYETALDSSLQNPEVPSRDQPDPLPPGDVGAKAISFDGERIYAYFQTDEFAGGDPVVERERRQFEVWALNGEKGTLWNRSDTEQRSTGVEGGPHTETMDGVVCCGLPAATENLVHIRLDAFQAFNKAEGAEVWSSPAGRTDQLAIQGSTGIGVRDGALIGTSPQTVYRLDPRSGDLAWVKTNPETDRTHHTSPVILDQETAYVQTIRNLSGFSGLGIDARDVETGELLWSWEYLPDVGLDSEDGWNAEIPSKAAFGPGVMVHAAKDGTVTVVGETEASLGDPSVDASTAYPDVGGEVSVDLSGTEAGTFGPATRYKAVWGDGTTTGWQSDPVLTHTYDEEGNHTARFVVGNANQTSSTTQTFHVGEDPPPSPNMAQKAAQTALADGNVDITFGVLGLVMAVTGGAVGVARRRRKRSRLQDELDAIERAYVETKHNPIECEAQLTERKTHARGLLLDGELDESQFQVVENRVEELLTELRRRSLDDEFDFLPHGLVKRGREMLEDGKVSALEADAFLRAVEEADMLSPEQKAVVRERIEEWRGRDAGGGGAG